MTATMQASEVREIANTIRKQIGVQGFMTLGASDLRYTTEDGKPGLTFKARILPFRKNGQRSTQARIMRVTILLNVMDAYDVEVGYMVKYDWQVHYAAKDIYADQLTALALDWDGPQALNPRYL